MIFELPRWLRWEEAANGSMVEVRYTVLEPTAVILVAFGAVVAATFGPKLTLSWAATPGFVALSLGGALLLGGLLGLLAMGRLTLDVHNLRFTCGPVFDRMRRVLPTETIRYFEVGPGWRFAKGGSPIRYTLRVAVAGRAPIDLTIPFGTTEQTAAVAQRLNDALSKLRRA